MPPYMIGFLWRSEGHGLRPSCPWVRQGPALLQEQTAPDTQGCPDSSLRLMATYVKDLGLSSPWQVSVAGE